MKKVYFYMLLVAFVGLSAIITSCSTNKHNPQSLTTEMCKTQDEADSVLNKYLKENKDRSQVYLTISKRKAYRKGVPNDYYDKFKNHLLHLNKFVSDAKKEYNIK